MNKSDTKYEINNIENYLPFISDTTDIFMIKYFIIMNNFVNLYFENIYDNVSISADKNYRYYIFVKGQEVLSNIIKILLLSTNNLDLVLYHTHKSYYYYIEFISQLESDNNQLELNVKDAIIFVYKKTIFELKSNIVDLNNSNNSTNNNLDDDIHNYTNNVFDSNNDYHDSENSLKIDNIEKTIEIVNGFINIFILKDLLNNSIVYTTINNTNISNNSTNTNDEIGVKEVSSLNITMNSIFKNITKISKYYVNETEYNTLLNDYLKMMRPLIHEFNKINIINNETYNINDMINFDLLLQLMEKIIMKISGLQNLNYTVNTDCISRDSLCDLNSVKIRDIVNNIMILA